MSKRYKKNWRWGDTRRTKHADNWLGKASRADHSENWTAYEKTGEWKGYEAYRPTLLSYSYVQQIANMIASQHNIKVEVGRGWQTDIKNKKLTYDPISLMYLNKGEVLALLLHEVGKITMSHGEQDIKNEYVSKYPKTAYEVISTFDDFRIDEAMIRSYPSAPEVYQSQDTIIKTIVADFEAQHDHIETEIKNRVKNVADMIQYHADNAFGGKLPDSEYIKAYQNATSCKPVFKTYAEYKKWAENFNRAPFDTIWRYLACVIDKGYGTDSMIHRKQDIELFNKTRQAIDKSVATTSTQAVADMLNDEVFLHIEHLLKAVKHGTPDMIKGLGKDLAENFMLNAMRGQQKSPDDSRGSKAGNKGVPIEWQTGDYASLKDSVSNEINSLTRRLINLRRKENTLKYARDQRRGLLDNKAMYKHRMGSTRIFKRKTEQVDTIRSFVFSVMVDISGSMNGDRIVHSTRMMIMLGEVFNKLSMDFEVIYFNRQARTLKNFNDRYDHKMKNKIAGMVKHAVGGTYLTSALKQSEITNRPELNRVAVVLTDGDTENAETLNQKFFSPWNKKGIKSVVIGIETFGYGIERLACGKGIKVNNVAEVPDRVHKILNELIIK